MSRQRDLIRELINNTTEHPTADMVFDMAKSKMSSISLATIYNNLNALTEKGEIRRLSTGESSCRYDNVHVEHDHAICSHCGKVKDVFLGDAIKEVLRQAGVYSEGYELTVKYLCDECKTKVD